MKDLKTDLGNMVELLEEAGIEREDLMRIIASSIMDTMNELDPHFEWILVVRRKKE